VIVIPKDAHSGDVQVEPGGGGDVQGHPGDGNRTQDVAVGEGERSALVGSGDRDEFKRTRVYLSRGLAAGASIFEELPVGAGLTYLLCGHALVVAVVELGQERRCMGVGEARNLGGAPGALQRARVDGDEADARQPGL
jgi:hypothetical protein